VLRAARVISLAICALVVLVPQPGARGDTAPGCRLADTRIDAQSPDIRALRVIRGDDAGDLVACSRQTGQLVYLGLGAYAPPALAVAGEFIVAGWDQCGPDNCETSVDVYRPLAGNAEGPLHQVYAPRFRRNARGRSIIGSVVALPNAGAAWIACQRFGEDFDSTTRHCTQPGRQAEVIAVSGFRGRRRLLDRGNHIDPSSLRLHGRTVSWRNNGARRTARM
jgi:hypothetical protein